MRIDSNPAPRSYRKNPTTLSRFWVFIILAFLIAVPIYISSSVQATGGKMPSSTADIAPSKPSLWNATTAPSNLLPFLPQAGPSIATYESDCTTPKTVFNLQASEFAVCAKATGFTAGQEILWSNPNFVLVQRSPVGGTGESTFTLNAGSSLGDWRVILYEPIGGDVYAISPFTVVDTDNPSADVGVDKGAASATVPAGSQAVYTVVVTNHGPSDAINVDINDSVPANTTFSSFALVSGPAGINCINPTAGSTGETICTAPTIARGETAVFLAAYDVISGTAPGTTISNTVSVSSDTADPRDLNDSSTSSISVSGAAAETCTLDCPANKVVTADTTQGGIPGAIVTYAAATVNGNCGAVTNTPSSGSFFAVGTHSIVSQSELGGASCTFTVTVLDSAPPTITCPANITATAGAGETTYILPSGPGTPTINASGGGTVTGLRSDDDADPDTPPKPLTDPYPIGSTGINWTVTDAGGRTASCTQIITIVAAEDRPPVTITCPGNLTFPAPNGSCEATIPEGTIGTPTTNPTTDVTVSPRRSDDRPLTNPFPAGATVITWTATDTTNGSVASCTQTVTVTVGGSGDTTPPTFTVVPQNVTTTTSSCTATLDDELGTAEAEDGGACSGSVTITRTGVPANFVFPTGTTTVIYTATDSAGNSTQVLQLVTVTESPAVNPTITAPADVSVNTGPGATSCGTVVSDAALASAIANDNCPGVTVVRTGVPAGNFFPVGPTIVTYTATDASGNTAQDTQTVTVTDNTVPVITPPAAVTLNTGPGATICGVTVADLDATLGTGSATDNCPGVGAVTRSGVPAGNVFPLGQTIVTYSATDAHGNTGSATQTVTVVDNTLPVVTAPGPVTLFTGPGATTCSVTPNNLDVALGIGSATDNCPGVGAVTRSGLPAGNVFPLGQTIVTYSATDAHGNTGSATQVVTVVDNTPPQISCPANITLEPTCPTGAIATWTPPVGTDNCPGATTTQTAGGAPGTVFSIGTTTVTYSVSDANGNGPVTCSFTVTVLTPQAVIQNLQAAVSASSLTGQQKNGLLAKLSAALQGINGGQINVACNKLSEFNGSVQNLVNHGDITAATGAAWISSSNHVRNTIGCTSLPCS